MIRCIDIETTGLDPAKDAIVEIASVDLQRDRTIGNEQTALICPPVPIPASASAVHHLVDRDVIGKPPLREVLPLFMGADVYVAHNSAFERSFLGEHFGDVTWMCTYKCALRVWPMLESHGLQFLRYHHGYVDPFNHERSTLMPHRALSDAIVTAAILVALTMEAKWTDLVRWSAEPALHTTITFGKYRGKTYAEIAQSDPDYLSWIVAKSDLDEGTKFSASHALGQGAGVVRSSF